MLVSEETSMVEVKVPTHSKTVVKGGGKTWMLLANKMAEVRLVSCARMRSHDTQARQLTTVMSALRADAFASLGSTT